MTRDDGGSGAKVDDASTSQCPNCGRKLLSTGALSQQPGEIIRGLKARRAYIPDALYEALRELERQLVCRANRCTPRQTGGGER